MTRRIALLRGINVGRAKRIAMADLRALFEELGFGDVRTLLNSGNVVFEAGRRGNRGIASSVEAAIVERFGFEVAVVVLSDKELDVVIAENALADVAADPSRLLVAFVKQAAALGEAEALLPESWKPDALAVGSKAAYLWCADGVLQSQLAEAFSRATGHASTNRNWATVLKLQDAAAKP
ncbi:MAG: DUF1697 domain-containing protein [Planctomycetota bacterium]